MLVYLSGPMSGLPGNNYAAFKAAAERLRSQGLSIINPAEITPPVVDPTWHDYLRADLKALLDCTHICLLPGWETSSGAHLELHIAHRLGLSIIHFEALSA